MLQALVKATDDDARAAARTWWVICMSSRVQECREAYGAWKAQAADALPSQLTAEHTAAAVSLPGFEPMARCILEQGDAIGIDPAATLDTVEAAGVKSHAGIMWAQAVEEVEPLRRRLQHSFLRRDAETSLLRRAVAGTRPKEVALAPSAGEMGIDELRVCQVWMYGLATRLQDCQLRASNFATAAGMSDPNSPLESYDEDRWDPTAAPWHEMEACVHAQATKAGAEADKAWRAPLGNLER